MSENRTIVACVQCHREVTLPPVPDKPGYVSIEPMAGWTAPPPRCPECSKTPLPEGWRNALGVS